MPMRGIGMKSTLPLHTKLTDEDVEYVAGEYRRQLKKYGRPRMEMKQQIKVEQRYHV